jgi:hypothetical protein
MDSVWREIVKRYFILFIFHKIQLANRPDQR